MNFKDSSMVGHWAYLTWQAWWLLLKAPTLTASSKRALPLPWMAGAVWKRRREVSSSWDSSCTGVAASSHTYLLPQSLSSMEAIALKMNSSPMVTVSTAARLPLLVAAAARPPSAPPTPIAARTPPNPASVAVPTLSPVMARPEAAPVLVVVVPPSVKNGKLKPEPMVPPLIRE